MITAVCSHRVIAAEVAPGETITHDEHGSLLIDEVRSTRDGLTFLGFPPHRSSGPRIAVRCEPSEWLSVVANHETVVSLVSRLELPAGVTEVVTHDDKTVVGLHTDDPTDWTLTFYIAHRGTPSSEPVPAAAAAEDVIDDDL